MIKPVNYNELQWTITRGTAFAILRALATSTEPGPLIHEAAIELQNGLEE